MPRHADYEGHKSRPGGNERDFNEDYHWTDKHAMKPNDWLTTNTQFLLPRVAYPAHRTPVSQGPLFPRRSPNVGVVASRYPVYTTGGVGHGGGPGYEDSEGSVSSKEEERKKKRTASRFILCITLVIFFVLIAIALAIVAIYLALRDNNTNENYVGTYEAKVHMANGKFTDKLEDVTSEDFKKEQEDFCSNTKASFDGAVKNCVVDAFSNGSLVIQSSLDFDLDLLEKLVKEGGSVPSEATITAAITRVLKVDDDVTVEWVLKEPESLPFKLRTWMKTDATDDDYCKAITEIYGSSLVQECTVTARREDYVNCTIRLDTKAMKTLARKEKRPSDIDGVRSVVLRKLVANKVEFFTSQKFLKDLSEVDEYGTNEGDTSSGGGDGKETTQSANTATTKQTPDNTGSTVSISTDSTTAATDNTASTVSTSTDSTTTSADNTASTVSTSTDSTTAATDNTASTVSTSTDSTTAATDNIASTVSTSTDSTTAATDNTVSTVSTSTDSTTAATDNTVSTVSTSTDSTTTATDNTASTVSTSTDSTTAATDNTASTVSTSTDSTAAATDNTASTVSTSTDSTAAATDNTASTDSTTTDTATTTQDNTAGTETTATATTTETPTTTAES